MRVVVPDDLVQGPENIIEQLKKERKEEEKTIAQQLREKAEHFNSHKYDKQVDFLIQEIDAGSRAAACLGRFGFEYYHKDFENNEIANRVITHFIEHGFKAGVHNDRNIAPASGHSYFIKLTW